MVAISSKMLLSLFFAPIFFGIHNQVTAVKMNSLGCCNGQETAGEQKTEVEGVDPTQKEDTPFVAADEQQVAPATTPTVDAEVKEGPPAAAAAEAAPAAEPAPEVVAPAGGAGSEEAGQASGGAGAEQNTDTSGAAAGTKKASKPCCSMM